jgi:transposase
LGDKTQIEIRAAFGPDSLLRYRGLPRYFEMATDNIKTRKMKSYINVLGVDLSKLTFDAVVIVNGQKDKARYKRFKKTAEGLAEFAAWLKQMAVALDAQTLVCMEFTGLYNRMLLSFLEKTSAAIWVEMGAHIKKSLGLQRGKSDKLDANRIALFAWRNQDEPRIWSSIGKDAQKIKDMLAQRERLVDTRSRLSVPLEEMEQEGLAEAAKQLAGYQKPVMAQLDKSIDKIERAIKEAIGENEKLKEKSELVQSVKGVGAVICWYIIAFTNGFEQLQSGKSLACYCGVAPFSETSGTSIKGKAKVSHIANKKLKSLLHMGALSAVQFDPELKAYYERKVKEGKNKMSVLNAVKNKLILRIAAVLREGREFEENYVRKAA